MLEHLAASTVRPLGAPLDQVPPRGADGLALLRGPESQLSHLFERHRGDLLGQRILHVAGVDHPEALEAEIVDGESRSCSEC